MKDLKTDNWTFWRVNKCLDINYGFYILKMDKGWKSFVFQTLKKNIAGEPHLSVSPILQYTKTHSVHVLCSAWSISLRDCLQVSRVHPLKFNQWIHTRRNCFQVCRCFPRPYQQHLTVSESAFRFLNTDDREEAVWLLHILDKGREFTGKWK
jgi:hypothetical protein